MKHQAIIGMTFKGSDLLNLHMIICMVHGHATNLKLTVIDTPQ